MTVNKRKKVVKYRSHTTHGGGHRKKRRGAGSRGGRGNAGTGKRAGHKKAGIKPKLGKSGFRPRRTVKSVKIVALNYFTSDRINALLKSGKILKEGDFVLLDLKKLGYDKLLGTGSVKEKLKIKVSQFSASAAEKVKAAGGEIVSEGTEEKSTEEAEVPAEE